MPKKLSVCMIVRNEREKLPQAIESVKRIADEIVVVDTGSTDDSVSVAESLGARVLRCEWQDDFSQVRNTSIDAARGDWILCLDADEIVLPESEGRITDAIVGGADAYYVRIESRVKSRAGKVFVNFVPRLFRKLEGVLFEGRVHEQIYPSLKRAGAKVEVSDIVLKHAGYTLSEHDLAEKAERNAKLLKKDLEVNPGDALTLFHLGEAYSMVDDYEHAAEYYRMALKAGELPREIFCVVLQNLGSALVKLGSYEDALVMLRRALEVDAGLLSAHLVMASGLYGMRKFARAEKEIMTYISRSQDTGRTRRLRLGHEPDIPAALVLLARCRLARKNIDGAKKALKGSLGMDEASGDAHRLMGMIAFEEMKFGQAAVHYEEAVKASPAEDKLYFELARAYVACGSTDKAAATIDRAVKMGIASAGLLRCLGVVRIKKKDFDGAIEAYQDALGLDPGDEESRRRLAGLYHMRGQDKIARDYLKIG
jgi:glycosyltransferase involved in cell wall biosynthesis